MNLAHEKSEAFQIVTHNKTFSLQDPALRLNQKLIPYNGAGAKLQYLGVEVSPWYEISNLTLQEDMKSCWERVRKLKLKPHQKLDMLTTYILSHFTYKLVASPQPNSRRLTEN